MTHMEIVRLRENDRTYLDHRRLHDHPHRGSLRDHLGETLRSLQINLC